MNTTFCVLCLLVIPGLSRLSAATERFAPPSACDQADNRTLPKVDRGLLLCYKKWTDSPSGFPNIFVFDGNGRQTASYGLWFDGATKIDIKDVAAAPNGAIVGVGSAIGSEGRMTGFFATMTGSQPAVRVVHPKTSIPYEVCAAQDGTFWTLVGAPPHEIVGEKDKDYDALLHIGVTGQVSGEFLPRSGFKTKADPAVPTNQGAPGLFCGKSGVSTYIPASGEWITVDGSGRVTARAQIPLIPFVKTSQHKIPLKYAQMWGMAMTESGAVYGSFQDERGPMLFRSGSDSFNLVAGRAERHRGRQDLSLAARGRSRFARL